MKRNDEIICLDMKNEEQDLIDCDFIDIKKKKSVSFSSLKKSIISTLKGDKLSYDNKKMIKCNPQNIVNLIKNKLNKINENAILSEEKKHSEKIKEFNKKVSSIKEKYAKCKTGKMFKRKYKIFRMFDPIIESVENIKYYIIFYSIILLLISILISITYFVSKIIMPDTSMVTLISLLCIVSPIFIVSSKIFMESFDPRLHYWLELSKANSFIKDSKKNIVNVRSEYNKNKEYLNSLSAITLKYEDNPLLKNQIDKETIEYLRNNVSRENLKILIAMSENKNNITYEDLINFIICNERSDDTVSDIFMKEKEFVFDDI